MRFGGADIIPMARVVVCGNGRQDATPLLEYNWWQIQLCVCSLFFPAQAVVCLFRVEHLSSAPCGGSSEGKQRRFK